MTDFAKNLVADARAVTANPVEPPPSAIADPAQLAAIVTIKYRGLLDLLQTKLKSSELAADLINEAIVIALEHVRDGRVKQLDSIGGYILQVALNLSRNYRRNMDNRVELRVDAEQLEALVRHDDDGLEIEQLKQQARSVMDSLDLARDRMVIKRLYVDEDDKQTICKDLRLTPRQFSQVLVRARRRMKQIFAAKGMGRADFFMWLLGILVTTC